MDKNNYQSKKDKNSKTSLEILQYQLDCNNQDLDEIAKDLYKMKKDFEDNK